MLISAEKIDDINARNSFLYAMEVFLRWYEKTGDDGYKETAEACGETSKALKEFIDHGDYTERDTRRRRVDSYLSAYER